MVLLLLFTFPIASRSTSLQQTPRSFSEHNGLLQTVTSWTTNKFSPTKFSTPSSTSASSMSSPSELMSSGSSTMRTPNLSYHDAKKSDKRNGGKVLGPHCAQFLSKLGLLKGTRSATNPAAEIDDHQCFRSNEMVCRYLDLKKEYRLNKSHQTHSLPLSYSAIAGNNATNKLCQFFRAANQSASKYI